VWSNSARADKIDIASNVNVRAPSMTDAPTVAAPSAASTPTSWRALAGWGLFAVVLAVSAAYVVFNMEPVRLWYFDYRFTRSRDDVHRGYWVRKIGRMTSPEAAQRLKQHALGDDEKLALWSALVLSTAACEGADERFGEVRKAWSPQRDLEFTRFLFEHASGSRESIPPDMLLQLKQLEDSLKAPGAPEPPAVKEGAK